MDSNTKTKATGETVEQVSQMETKMSVVYNEACLSLFQHVHIEANNKQNGQREPTTAPNASANSEPEINYLEMTTNELCDYVKALDSEVRRDMMHFVIMNLPTKEFVDFCLGVEGSHKILASAAKMAKEKRDKELVEGAKIAAEIDCGKDSTKKPAGEVEHTAVGDGGKTRYSGGWLKLL